MNYYCITLGKRLDAKTREYIFLYMESEVAVQNGDVSDLLKKAVSLGYITTEDCNSLRVEEVCPITKEEFLKETQES